LAKAPAKKAAKKPASVTGPAESAPTPEVVAQ
jgi:hypothetical protein